MSTVFIDADACPVKREAISVARAAGWKVVMVSNSAHDMSRYARNGVEIVTVGVGRDAADFAIVEMLTPDDVVVTQDIGVAAMALGRGAGAISNRGRIFHKATIDLELEVRHAEQRERRAGKRTKGGPPAFDDDDREHFADQLERLLREKRRGTS